MAIMEISVIPLGTCSTSFSHFVAEIQKELAKTGLAFELTDMGTIIEGDMATLTNIMQILHELPFNMGEKRVYTIVKIDDRRDKKTLIGDKTKSVRDKLSASNLTR